MFIGLIHEKKHEPFSGFFDIRPSNIATVFLEGRAVSRSLRRRLVPPRPPDAATETVGAGGDRACTEYYAEPVLPPRQFGQNHFFTTLAPILLEYLPITKR